MALTNRILTEQERQNLLNSSLFTEKCQMSIRDYATYWAANDGSGANTEALRIKWAKDRLKSVGILLGGINNSRINEIFVNASKGKQLNLDTAPVDVSTIIAAWDANSTFDEFVSQYFDIISSDIIFKIGS